MKGCVGGGLGYKGRKEALCFDVCSKRAIKGGAGGSLYQHLFISLLSGGEQHVFLSDLESDKDAAPLPLSVIVCSDRPAEMAAVLVPPAWRNKTSADKTNPL